MSKTLYLHINLDQGFPNGGDFSKLGVIRAKGWKGEGWLFFKTLKLLLDILELQMMSKKNMVLGCLRGQ